MNSEVLAEQVGSTLALCYWIDSCFKMTDSTYHPPPPPTAKNDS